MPTPPTGTGPAPKNATTQERGILGELFRAGEHAPGQREAKAIRDGLALLVELIETRNRRMSSGYFDQFDPAHGDD